MAPGTAPRLSRERILDAALQLSEQRPEHPAETLSGQSLGNALSVDRSAIWRHFAHKDDLLLAVADRLLGVVLAEMDVSADPYGRLASLFRTTIEVFRRYPRVGGQLASRTIMGENGMRVAELMIGVFVETGSDPSSAVLAYRVFVDTGLSYAAMSAQHSVRPRGAASREATEYAVAIARLDPARFPQLRAHAAELLAIQDEVVADQLLASLWGAREGGRDGHEEVR